MTRKRTKGKAKHVPITSQVKKRNAAYKKQKALEDKAQRQIERILQIIATGAAKYRGKDKYRRYKI